MIPNLSLHSLMTQSEKTIVHPLIRKLEEIEQQFTQLQESLNDPEVQASPQRFIAASKDSGKLGPVVQRFRDYKGAARAVDELREMAGANDAEMAELANSELPEAEAKATQLLEALKDEFVAAEDN